jgi:hypothetical protein
METEHRAKDEARLLFFVIDGETRAVAATVEVAYLVAKGRPLVLVLTGLKGPGHSIMGEPLSDT